MTNRTEMGFTIIQPYETSQVVGHVFAKYADQDEVLDPRLYLTLNVGDEILVWCRIEAFEGVMETDRGDPAGRLQMVPDPEDKLPSRRAYTKKVSGHRYIPQRVDTMPEVADLGALAGQGIPLGL